MADHENELIIGIGRDGEPVKVLVIEDETVTILNRLQEEADARSGHGKSNLALSEIQELARKGREARLIFDAKTPEDGTQDPNHL